MLCSCEFWAFFVLLFWSFGVFNLFSCLMILNSSSCLVILWVFKKNYVTFQGGAGRESLEVFNFSSCDFGGLPKTIWFEGRELFCSCGFWKFFVLLLWSFEVFNLSSCHFVGLQNNLCFFVFIFWSFRIFNFLLVILGVFKKICVKFHKWGNGACELWKFCFCILKFQNIQFSSCHFGNL